MQGCNDCHLLLHTRACLPLSWCLLTLQITLETKDVFIEATATDLTKAKVIAALRPCPMPVRKVPRIGTIDLSSRNLASLNSQSAIHTEG